MEPDQIPSAWIGQSVRIELRDASAPQGATGGSRFGSSTGTLQALNELGVVMQLPRAMGRQETTRFYPWSAVRSITAL
jgi:hypothetical protein